MNYVIIKCGGSVFERLPSSFYQNIAEIHKQGKWQPVIVHGGGPLISKLLDQTGVKTTFVDGLRVTTNEVLDVVEMALSGAINKQIVRKLTETGVKAVGLSGVDGKLLQAKPIAQADKLGFVGEAAKVHTELIKTVANEGLIPVISPVGVDDEGQRYNINADMAASAVAQALHAKLCFVSDIPGIYEEINGEKHVFHHLNEHSIKQLIEKKIITDGMIPKVNSALEALYKNVSEVSIVDGMYENGLLQFMEGKSIGTRISLEKEVSKVGTN